MTGLPIVNQFVCPFAEHLRKRFGEELTSEHFLIRKTSNGLTQHWYCACGGWKFSLGSSLQYTGEQIKTIGENSFIAHMENQ